MSRIGVFICHCGENIARTVDCAKVAEETARLPGVLVSVDYKYVCSDPGQNMIKEAIKEHKLDGVVVAACSPHMHEPTFRAAAVESGLNPYLCEMANIREHCSWVHLDREQATEKAIDLVRVMVEKVKKNQELFPIKVPVTKRALVVGGGIAGIQAALDIAAGGHEVILVERLPSIGGNMARLSETFPTLDCSQCILTPRMVEVARDPRITLHTYAEVEQVEGFVGNFKVKVKKKSRYVDADECTGCGDCIPACPVRYQPQIQPLPKYSDQMDPAEIERLDQIIARYTSGNGDTPAEDMLVQILQDVNLEYNYLPEHALKYVSEVLEVPLSRVYHVATFYTAFSLRPRGKHLIRVCMGTACYARGSSRVLEELERSLEISAGETTADSLFTLETVNCLGCCALGPVVMVDRDYYSATPDKVEGLLKRYKSPK